MDLFFDLSEFKFTDLSDRVVNLVKDSGKLVEGSSVLVPAKSIVEALDGNDNVVGKIDASVVGDGPFLEFFTAGVDVSGIFYAGEGNDTISGLSRVHVTATGDDIDFAAGENSGISVGEIYSGNGDDLVKGVARSETFGADAISSGLDLRSSDRIDTGRGKDRVVGIGVTSVVKDRDNEGGVVLAVGINSSGEIETGREADKVLGSATSKGRFTGKDSFASISARGLSNFHLDSGSGDDTMEGEASASAVALGEDSTARAGAAGISSRGFGSSWKTGAGDDAVSGIATANAFIHRNGKDATANAVGIAADVSTGRGNDSVKGHAEAFSSASTVIATGITTKSIETGSGHDSVIGYANATALGRDTDSVATGIDNEGGVINTGDGKDVIRGEAVASQDGEVFGIFGGTINLGADADCLIASSLGGDVDINLGEGNDRLTGFGEALANGGEGFDVIKFSGHALTDFDIVLGSSSVAEVSFKLKTDGTTMVMQQFEKFIFTDGSLTFTDLVDSIA